MKKWFLKFNRSTRLCIIISLYILLFILSGIYDEKGDENLNSLISFLVLIDLIFAIVFTVYHCKNNKIDKQNKNISKQIANKEIMKQEIKNESEDVKYKKEQFNHKIDLLYKVIVDVTGDKVNRKHGCDSPYTSSANITFNTPITKYKDFIAIDTETTGIYVGGNDVIEVAAIKFINFEPVEMFTTLLKPRNPIPAEAIAIHNITDDMVKNAPKFGQIKKSLEDFIGDLPIVAHNAIFDIKFLFVSGLDFKENTTFYDTLWLSRRYIRDDFDDKLPSYKLSSVCNECGIYFDGAHRSSADALACGLLFIEIIKTIKNVDSTDKL